MPPETPRRPRDALAPVDRVHLGFYGFVLLACALRAGALPEPWKPIAWYSFALSATLLLARGLAGRRGLSATLPRTFFALVVAPFTFLMLSFVVPYANPFHGERWLFAVDTATFGGVNPNVWIDERSWPPLTEVAQWVYASYYAIPLVLLAAFLLARRPDSLERALFTVLLCLYASYVGYFLVPATGPNLNRLGLFPPHFADPMPGTWMAERLRAATLEAEWIKHDCWPSGHVALSLTCLSVAWRERARAAFAILLLPVLVLCFSTVYLRYHYVFDVVCGVLLWLAVVRFAPRLYARWRRSEYDAPALTGPRSERSASTGPGPAP